MRQRITLRSKVLLGLAVATGMTVSFAQPPPAPARTAAARPQADHRTQGPQDLTPAEQRALQAAFPKYLRMLEAGLRGSKSARDRALSTQIVQLDESGKMRFVGNDPVRGDLLRKAAEAAPQDHLVQWFWATASDGESGCSRADPCPGRGRALAVLEPENGAAWIPAVASAFEAGDVAGTDEALARMAKANRFDNKSHDLLEALDEIVRRYPPIEMPTSIPGIEPPKPGSSDPAFVKFLEFLVVKPGGAIMSSTTVLSVACDHSVMCRADSRRAANCAKAARLLLDKGDSMMVKLLGMSILESSPAPDAEDRMRIRTYAWQMEQYVHLLQSANEAPAVANGVAEPIVSDGEFATMIEQLRRAHMPLTPPGGWNPSQRPEPAFEACPK